MAILHRRSLPRGAFLLLAASLTACRSIDDDQPPQPGPDAQGSSPFSVHALGRGIFAPTRNPSAGRAWFKLKGDHSYSGPVGGSVVVHEINVYGASGPMRPKQLLGHPLTIEPISDLQAPWKTYCQAPWDPSEDSFSMLVRYVYDETTLGITTKGKVADRWGVYGWVVPSIRIIGQFPQPTPDGGDAITAVQAGGTFSGVQGCALYDVHVTWNGTATAIRVWAAPGNLTTVPQIQGNLVGGNPTPDNTAHSWDGIDLGGSPGSYDGTSDTYTMLVKISFSGEAGDSEIGTFTDILAQQADELPWEP